MDMILTQTPVFFDPSMSWLQDKVEEFEPVENIPVTTFPIDPGLPSGIAPTKEIQEIQKTFEPPIVSSLPQISADSMPLQIWEGVVSEVNIETSIMHVMLNAKIGQMPRHTGEIDLEWVSDQDKELVRPGAVFYLTLFKRTKRGGSIENSQELRFRRRPSWTASQLKQVKEDAGVLHSKMKSLPTSE